MVRDERSQYELSRIELMASRAPHSGTLAWLVVLLLLLLPLLLQLLFVANVRKREFNNHFWSWDTLLGFSGGARPSLPPRGLVASTLLVVADEGCEDVARLLFTLVSYWEPGYSLARSAIHRTQR